MKNLFQGIGYPIVFSLTLLACDNDPIDEEGKNASRVTVQFQTATREIPENGNEEIVSITFNKPALAEGNLILKTGNIFDEAFATTPPSQDGMITIPIQKGDNSASLKLSPLDNAEKDGHRIALLTFGNLEEQFVSGFNKTISITVKDDETTHPIVESIANFINQDIVLEEANAVGIEYQIHFSEAVAVDSEIKISVAAINGIYGLHYLTEPLADNHIVTLPVTAGLRVIGFRVKPIANEVITGELKISMTIAETSGSIRKGSNLEESFIIKDDELAQKPKGYEVTAGNSILKKFFEYNTHGRISRVNWENYTPYLTHGTDTYHYDANNQLIKINKSAGRDIMYEWSNGRIIKSNDVQDGVIKSYTDYAYDEMGNLAGAAPYYRQQDGSFQKGLFTIYLYFTDGNLYKSLTYQDSGNPEDPFLVSTKTYNNYIGDYNPFPMTEVLPVVNMQTKLATTYTVEEYGIEKTYHMVYEYLPDGLPAKRIATSNSDVQTAVYHYY